MSEGRENQRNEQFCLSEASLLRADFPERANEPEGRFLGVHFFRSFFVHSKKEHKKILKKLIGKVENL